MVPLVVVGVGQMRWLGKKFSSERFADELLHYCHRLLRKKVGSQPVWPDWVMIKSFWLQLFLQEKPNLKNFFGLFEKHQFSSKTVVASFWAIFGKFGLLFTSASGHSARQLKWKISHRNIDSISTTLSCPNVFFNSSWWARNNLALPEG